MAQSIQSLKSQIDQSTINDNEKLHNINTQAIQNDITHAANVSTHPTAIKFNITGFGQFQGVAHNPTTTIVQTLPQLLQQQPDIQLSSATVLPTEANSVKILQQIHQSSSNGTITVFVHFGVNKAAKQFAIEICAYNNASFGCPDVSGYQPHKTPINNNIEFEQAEYSKLDVYDIVNQLQQLKYDVNVSSDPGRCMYCIIHTSTVNSVFALLTTLICIYINRCM